MIDKTLICAPTIERMSEHPVKSVLVVGCGTGQDAVTLSSYFNCNSIGIDLNPDSFLEILPKNVTLLKADATVLPFEQEEFDVIFSYHCIEHIPNFRLALMEMKRVLKTGGVFYFGVPNRQRLIGYFSSPLKDFISWNYEDYMFRIRGKFKNEYGAHAGFIQSKFLDELKEVFNTVENVTKLYYRELYNSKRFLISVLEQTKLYKILYPSIYFAGKK